MIELAGLGYRRTQNRGWLNPLRHHSALTVARHGLCRRLGLWPQDEIEDAGCLCGLEIVLSHQDLMVRSTHTDVNV